jgi:tRNA-Thr(GGU) m(6)t(6)A37 methyltransferase TsaA
VEVYPEFAEGLEDVEGFSYIFLLWLLDRSPGYELRIVPFADDQPRGLFSTRYPGRPNPIGLSVVRVLGRHDNILDIEGLDMWDETPLLDIKPYIPIVDAWTDARTGWYGERSQTEKRPSQ